MSFILLSATIGIAELRAAKRPVPQLPGKPARILWRRPDTHLTKLTAPAVRIVVRAPDQAPGMPAPGTQSDRPPQGFQLTQDRLDLLGFVRLTGHDIGFLI